MAEPVGGSGSQVASANRTFAGAPLIFSASPAQRRGSGSVQVAFGRGSLASDLHPISL